MRSDRVEQPQEVGLVAKLVGSTGRDQGIDDALDARFRRITQTAEIVERPLLRRVVRLSPNVSLVAH